MDLLSSLGINSTFYIQLINFVVLVFILKVLLYKPLLQTMDARRKDAEAIKETKETLDKKLAEIDKMYQAKLEEASAKVEEIIKKAKISAQQEAQKIIESAEKEKATLLKMYKESLDKQLKEHKKHLKDEVLHITLTVFKGIFKDDSNLQKKMTDKIIEMLNEKG